MLGVDWASYPAVPGPTTRGPGSLRTGPSGRPSRAQPRRAFKCVARCCEIEIDDEEVLRAKCDRIKTFHMGNQWDYAADHGYDYEYSYYDIHDTYYDSNDSNDSDDSWSSEDASIESWTTPEPI